MYPDGTAVPANLVGPGLAFEWEDDTYPLAGDPAKKCVAMKRSMKFVNVECDGYSSGKREKRYVII